VSNRDSLKQTIHVKSGTNEKLIEAKRKIRKLKEDEYWKQVYILLSFFFFLLVCLYVFNKRIPIITLVWRIISKIIEISTSFFNKESHKI
jgi:hypothetical protein